MTETLHVVCPDCGTVNRVPRAKLAAEGRCGRCKSALFDDHPIELDARAFRQQVENSELPVVVDFWAPWCGPCKMMAPQYEAAARAVGHAARFTKLNTDAEPEISGAYYIRSIPTMAIFRKGQELARTSGALPASQIADWVRRHIA